MPAEHSERVAEIVESALELAPTQRPEFLDQSCGDDRELRAEVESLLSHETGLSDFIETPPYATAAEALLDSTGKLTPGESLGDYRIISLLGEGGMGEVYLAEDTALERQVAIKLVKGGFETSSFLRHIRNEERILAGLNHPNIAHLYGGEITAEGLPYFVMEYVEGQRIDDYCRERRLTIRQRVELFREVCAGVAYAHQHLVIHRDLKPANIWVTPEGEPKLLDFGIAKLLDPNTSTLADQTVTMQALMTPDYSSPEQVRGETMTTASDVYSLGVVLYELFTTERPYRFKTRRPDEIVRVIAEQEPRRPSMAVNDRDSRIENRESNESRFTIHDSRALRGDLDNIVLKALRKEPERRYATAAQFSEDLRRHLAGLPVIARKDTLGYRAGKFVVRNRIAVTAAVVVASAIVAGLITVLWEAENVRRQRDVAQRERLKAERISAFLQETLGAAAPEAKGIDVKVSDILEEASRRAQSELARQPEVLAEVLTTLGRTYISLGVYAPAIRDLRAAAEAAGKARSNRAAAVATAWLAMALEYHQESAEARKVAQHSVVLNRRIAPKGSPDLAVALFSLGASQMDTGDVQRAQVSLKEAVELARKYFGETHGYYLAALNMLALLQRQAGDYAAAKELYRRVLDARDRVESRYRIYIAQAAAYLGPTLIETAEYEEAEQRLQEAESMYRALLGEKNSSVPVLKTHFGNLYFRKGDYSRAEAAYRQALELFPVYFAADEPLALSTKAALGQVLTRQGKPVEGERLLREALELREKKLPATDPELAYNKTRLGECLLAQKRFAEAEPLLVQAYQQLHHDPADSEPRAVEARSQLRRLYETWGKPELAAQYQ